ncbi:unnamed protein product, partial [Rotaria sp. Silwood1]
MTLDKFVAFDQQQIEFINKLQDIYNMLNKESNKIQKNLLNITTARYHSNHANFSLNAKLKYLSVDYSGNLIEQPLCLVDEHNMPISDELNLIRLPFESDRFYISNDKHELIIVDKNEMSLSEPITFKKLTLESIEFEYIDDYRKTIQIIEISSNHSINKSISLNVKSIFFDKLPPRIHKLEKDLIQQLIQISIQLNDPLIIKQVKNLTNHMQDTQLLNELRSIILSGIKIRAKTIEEKFETLLINIQNKSHELKQSQRIRFEYVQFLYIRFNEEMEREK